MIPTTIAPEQDAYAYWTGQLIEAKARGDWEGYSAAFSARSAAVSYQEDQRRAAALGGRW